DVLAQSGCLPRDAVGRRTIYEVTNGTGSWGRELPPGGLMAGLTPGKAPPDGDSDGMPDAWERERGLDPADPKDALKTVPAGASPGDRHKGYTYIEYYVNELADLKVAAAMARARLDRTPPAEPPKPEYMKPSRPVAELVADVTMQNAKIKQTETNKTFRAIWLLSRMDPRETAPAVAPLVADLDAAMKAGDKRKACFVAWALGVLGPGADAKAVVPALMKALEHDWKSANTKWQFCPHGFIAWALGRYGPAAADAVPLLARTMHGADSWARQPASWALAEIGAKSAPASAELVKALERAEGLAWGASAYGGGTRHHAARALAGIGKPAVPRLTEVLDGGSEAARRGAAMALGRMGTDAAEAVPALVKALGSRDPVVRGEVALAISKTGPGAGGAASALAGLLKDGDYGVRANAARALGDCGPAAASAVPALKAALKDESREVRYAAFVALGKVGPAAVPALTEVLGNEDDAWNRARAARALCAIGPGAAPAIDALVKALGAKGTETRREAVWALAAIGPAAKKAAADVKRAASDPDYVVRYAAGELLKKLGK
ncbi:MAG: HEAT repeat domain-containing protein, partial [Planctomycetota bacterium]